jgi:hypothetical protein
MNLPHKLLVERLTKHSQALALPLGRRVGQPGHDVARDYLLKQMKLIGLKPFRGKSYELRYELPHPSNRKLTKFTNLVGVIPGKDRSLPPILLGAHYDSVIDAPCVDDNATSVAHNIMLAEHYSKQPLNRDLIIAFFDSEEQPFFMKKSMGARRFYEDYCSKIDFAAVIVTDLVGHNPTDVDLLVPPAVMALLPHLKNLIAVFGAESDGTFPYIVEAASRETKNLRVLASLDEYTGSPSDHAPFASAGQPFLFLSCGRGRHYHSPQDTMEWINFEKLAHTTRFISDLVDRIDHTPTSADHAPTDPFDIEMRMIRKAIGPALPIALKYLRIGMPKTREELTQLVDDLAQGKIGR